MVDQWELYNQGYIRGPMGWGTIQMGTNEMGGAWVLIGGPMRWGTNEMGDQWDRGTLGLAENGWANEKGDQWEGGGGNEFK